MDIIRILQVIRPGAEWSLTGESSSGIEWLDKTQAKPTEKELLDAWNQLQATETSKAQALSAAKTILHDRLAAPSDRLDALITILGL